MKWSYLTQMLHLSKPWLAIPVPSGSKSSGINLSQIFSQESGSDPLTQSQLLQGATSVHQVGTGSIDGVPVTEYTGTLPLDKAISYLSGAAKTAAAAGDGECRLHRRDIHRLDRRPAHRCARPSSPTWART